MTAPRARRRVSSRSEVSAIASAGPAGARPSGLSGPPPTDSRGTAPSSRRGEPASADRHRGLRSRLRRDGVRRALAILLLGCAAILGTTLVARTASAQETLFSATLTVVDNPGFAGSDSIGYYSFSQSPSTSFTHDGKTFHMNLLGIDRDGCGATQAELSVQGFFGNGRWGAHSKESWVLLLGSRQFSFAAAERSGGEVQWCLDSVDVPGWEDGDEIAVKLLSSASGASTDASLSGLGLSPGALTPAFDAETTQYTATVENTVERVTVTAAATADSEATVAYLDASDAVLADADGGSDGHQVDLTVGANTIKVEVTAADAVTVRTYTLAVTRQASTSGGVVPTSTPPASETIFSGTLTVVANPSYATANAGSIGYWGVWWPG